MSHKVIGFKALVAAMVNGGFIIYNEWDLRCEYYHNEEYVTVRMDTFNKLQREYSDVVRIDDVSGKQLVKFMERCGKKYYVMATVAMVEESPVEESPVEESPVEESPVEDTL